MFYKDYELAGIVVRVIEPGEYMVRKGRDYETDKPYDFIIQVDKNDIEFEKKTAMMMDKDGLLNFSDDEYQFSAIYRKFCEEASKKNILLFHGSALEYQGECVIITAPSGTGKSTHVRLWKDVYNVDIINDDKPLLKVKNNEIEVWGTPWNGKHDISINRCSKLKAICVLSRAKENSIVKVNAKNCLEELLNQIYRPRQVENLVAVMDLTKNVLEKVDIYQINCNMDRDAAVTVKREIFGE